MILFSMKYMNQMLNWSICFQFLLLLLASSLQFQTSHALKSAVFLSPAFELEPGSVINKFYHGIDFPTGHIAVKAFDAEVVDEEGNPVPLHETYLHHWIVARFHQRKGVDIKLGFHESDSMMIRNSGLCENTLGQYFGLGSETRKTPTDVPDPYGIVAGNPEEVPEGYEEKWLMNVHAIDTRGTEDRFGCAECRCDLYNVTIDEYGRTLRPGYVGGLLCCYDEMKCRLKNGFSGVKRKLFMRYTIKWVDFDESVVPVKVYLLDVTDLWKKKIDDPNGEGTRHLCLVEYNVESCTNGGGDCTDTKRVSLQMPTGGVVIYGVAHQHTGGIGSALYGEDGRVICSSKPTYGKGKEVGDEKGYIVGMSTCYPRPGSVNISDGEILVFESNYSSTRRHTGVMGLFYLLVADHGSSSSLLPTTNSIHDSNDQKHEKAELFVGVWGVVFLGAVIAMAVAVTYRRKEERNDGYQSIVI